ncbi:MAG: 1-acyl-sn-glycerol-3-phosphate acyltransferase [Candidatus Aminicenantales bacterium]
MARKKIITLGYILVFWGLVPGTLAALAAWGERAFGPGLRLPNLMPAGLLLAGSSGFLLALSIVQFTRAAGSLPISAFPPQRLIRSGVFGVWRHPIYLFSVFFWSGWEMTFWPAGTLLVAFPALALGALGYARMEERALGKRFGSFYDGHRRQTCIIIPRLFHLVRPLFSVLSRFCFRYEVSAGDNAAPAPPFFVISAHRNYLDSIFISLALNVPVHFITTFEMFRKTTSRFLFLRLLGLPKRRFKPDVRNALDVRRRLLEGCAVGIFPEAERSWTGAMIGFKTEALKLLQNRADIPILPVRLEGTYAAWPRWARGPRPSKVAVIIEKPVFAIRGENPAELEARLSRLIEPRLAPDSGVRPPEAAGIESLIYRCPECLSYDTVQSGKGPDFSCSKCLARFRLLPDYSVEMPGHAHRTSLESMYRRIRMATDSPISAPGSGITWGRAELAIEKLGRFEGVGPGRLELTSCRLTFESGGTLYPIELDSIRSVVVEGARKFQVYGGRPSSLFQFALLSQSALKWQSLVVDTVRRRHNFMPSTA